MIKESETGLGKSREHTESKATMNDQLSISSLSFASSGWFCFQKSLHGPSLLVLCRSRREHELGNKQKQERRARKEKEQRYKQEQKACERKQNVGKESYPVNRCLLPLPDRKPDSNQCRHVLDNLPERNIDAVAVLSCL